MRGVIKLRTSGQQKITLKEYKGNHILGDPCHLQSIKDAYPGFVVPASLRKGRHAAALSSPEIGRRSCGREGARGRLLLCWRYFHY